MGRRDPSAGPGAKSERFAKRTTASPRCVGLSDLPGLSGSPGQCVPSRELLVDCYDRNGQITCRPRIHSPHHDGVAAVVQCQDVGVEDEEAHNASGSSSGLIRCSSIASRQGSNRGDESAIEPLLADSDDLVPVAGDTQVQYQADSAQGRDGGAVRRREFNSTAGPDKIVESAVQSREPIRAE
jgi:hypothetical protein